jgi:hypothetical protein
MQLELWPPKPNEFDTAAVMLCFWLTFGTTSMPAISSIGFCTRRTRCVSQLVTHQVLHLCLFQQRATSPPATYGPGRTAMPRCGTGQATAVLRMACLRA